MTTANKQEFVITRTFPAPRDLVFRVMTEAGHLEHWWGPKGLILKVVSLDVRPGGIFHYAMETADGPVMWGRFAYREVVAPEKLVFTSSFADADGNVIRAPFSQSFPMEVWNTWTLTEADGQTTLTLTGGPHDATAEEYAFYESMFTSMQQGFGGTFDQLDAYLATL